MIFVAEAIACVFLLIGAAFVVVGSLGLVKLSDTMQRLHGPTKATTLGIGSILVGSIIFSWAETGTPSIHEFLIVLFLFLTAPITAHLISRAYGHEMAIKERESENVPDAKGTEV